MISDLHIHTIFSSDSETNPEDIINKAISFNIPYICFTDHNEFDYDDNLFILDTTSYFNTLLNLKEKYKEKIKVLIGVEQGLETTKSAKINNFLKSFPFDFIIGSSHMVNGIDPYYPVFFEGRSTYEAICEYFSSVLDNLDTFNNFDVYGHIDYVIRYPLVPDIDYSFEKYKEYLVPILTKIIQSGKGIELNTGGFRSKIKESNPSFEIIKKYRELGGEIITVGSDAHNLCDVASGFSKAKEYLTLAGFDYYNVFINRKPIKIKLD